MTTRDISKITERLRAAQARLAAAPTNTREAAKRDAYPDSHQAGALEQVCRNEASVLLQILEQIEASS